MPRKDRKLAVHWPHEVDMDRVACGAKMRIATTDPDLVTCGGCKKVMERTNARKNGAPVPMPQYAGEEYEHRRRKR